jgi:hypothetical protein
MPHTVSAEETLPFAFSLSIFVIHYLVSLAGKSLESI